MQQSKQEHTTTPASGCWGICRSSYFNQTAANAHENTGYRRCLIQSGSLRVWAGWEGQTVLYNTAGRDNDVAHQCTVHVPAWAGGQTGLRAPTESSNRKNKSHHAHLLVSSEGPWPEKQDIFSQTPRKLITSKINHCTFWRTLCDWKHFLTRSLGGTGWWIAVSFFVASNGYFSKWCSPCNS